MSKTWNVTWNGHKIIAEDYYFSQAKLYIDGSNCDNGTVFSAFFSVAGNLRGQVNNSGGSTHVVVAKFLRNPWSFERGCHIFIDDQWVGGDPIASGKCRDCGELVSGGIGRCPKCGISNPVKSSDSSKAGYLFLGCSIVFCIASFFVVGILNQLTQKLNEHSKNIRESIDKIKEVVTIVDGANQLKEGENVSWKISLKRAAELKLTFSATPNRVHVYFMDVDNYVKFNNTPSSSQHLVALSEENTIQMNKDAVIGEGQYYLVVWYPQVSVFDKETTNITVKLTAK